MRCHCLACRKLQLAGSSRGRGPVPFRRTRLTSGVVWNQPEWYKGRQAPMLNDGSKVFLSRPLRIVGAK